MYRILLIDDDPTILEGLTVIIQDHFSDFFQCSTASDGGVALDLLKKSYYHLIISDNKMPKLDGLSLLRIIKENHIPSSVIILSGFDDYNYIRSALKSGAYDYLLKPVNIREFTNMIRTLIPRLKDRGSLLPDTSPARFLPDEEPPVPYFDMPETGEPMTLKDLKNELYALRQFVLQPDTAALDECLESIFSRLSPNLISQTQLLEELASFVYTLMQSNNTLIQIITEYKLTNHDILNHIKNNTCCSQLKELLKSDLSLYMAKLGELKKEQAHYMVRKTKLYIEEHLSGSLTLSDISSQFKLHPGYFSTLFKAAAGISIRDCILQMRMEKAKELLKEPDQKILDIAWSVGYQDAAHFNRAFKKTTGLSPSQFRDFSKES